MFLGDHHFRNLFFKNLNFCKKLDKIFQILEKKLKEVPMLGFEHPSHMVTHPSTDEAQCCLTLEILKK